MDPEKKVELRNKLREKIGERQIIRKTKQAKGKIFEKTMNDLGLDKDKFEQDFKDVQKSGKKIDPSTILQQ